jgi:uncharacterized protein YbbC (DUF1343 family)
MMKRLFLCLSILFISSGLHAQKSNHASNKPIPGAERLDVYLPILKGKKIAVFANQTSMVGNTHLVDTLKKSGVNIKVIFGPEHGFRGIADAGEKVGNYIDEDTGIPVVSLYGSKRKPSAEDLKDVDLMLFDIQDVGVRFYTYISSLQEYIESAVENNKPIIILDRPNPNGFYVDGPVLDKKFKSFVGMQPIPIVYGMTIGEYANMLVQEAWLNVETPNHISIRANEKTIKGESFLDDTKIKNYSVRMQIITCANYTHKSKYILPIKPSPNLPEIQSIYWYPSTCFFEGTVLSEGRGTEKPFQIFGHPSLPKNLYAFTPVSKPGATNPKLKDKLCYGWNISGTPDQVLQKANNKIQLEYLINAYKAFPNKDSFFLLPKSGKPEESFFAKLAGNAELMEQLKEGKTETDIRKSWEPALSNFKKIRKKYLLYTDF